jgi:predicted PurR-regulated permease PerM
MAETTIPAVVEFAEKQGVELPFSDWQSLRQVTMEEITQRLANVPKYANVALFQLVYLIIGMVVAISVFLHARLRFDDDPAVSPESMYARTTLELTWRFQTFYRSFSQVMGAQIVISLINTTLTAVFLVVMQIPYAPVLIVATFLCGLVPIIGNIISNTLITAVGLADSPKTALVALGYLVAIHKLEYFLNSKIIGDRIRNPMWLTLIGLLLGEKLMGIPGMILAPVVLHYIKVETSRATVAADSPAAPTGAD